MSLRRLAPLALNTYVLFFLSSSLVFSRLLSSSLVPSRFLSFPLVSSRFLSFPVMGGKSTGTFTVTNNTAVFDGDVVDVPFLKAPGFIKADTSGSYPDASGCSGIYLMAKSTTNYTGYRFSFGTAKAPGGGFFSYGYKTHFDAPLGSNFKRVELPFNEFSDAWNDGTGNLDHTCAENKVYCPSTKQLQDFQTMSLWGEGVGGKVHLTIDEIGVMNC
jgi:hypothetical protein